MCANSDNMQDLGALRETTSTTAERGVTQNVITFAPAVAGINDWASSALRMHLGERPTSHIKAISNCHHTGNAGLKT